MRGRRRSVPADERATFQGIVRSDGRVATRNYLGILTSVNCSATAARLIADQFRGAALADSPMSTAWWRSATAPAAAWRARAGMDVLRRTLAGYARHANFAGVLILGLGCEANQIGGLMAAEGLEAGPLLHTMTIQEPGGTAQDRARGGGAPQGDAARGQRARRETVPASHITLALQCGGSDGYSGITANPALGAAIDMLVRHGGTAMLSRRPRFTAPSIC